MEDFPKGIENLEGEEKVTIEGEGKKSSSLDIPEATSGDNSASGAGANAEIVRSPQAEASPAEVSNTEQGKTDLKKLNEERSALEIDLKRAREKKDTEKVRDLEGALRDNKSKLSFYRREQIVAALSANEEKHLKELEVQPGSDDIKQSYQATREARIFSEQIQRQRRELIQTEKKAEQLFADGDTERAGRLRAYSEELRRNLYQLEDREEALMAGGGSKTKDQRSDSQIAENKEQRPANKKEETGSRPESVKPITLQEAREVFAKSEIALEKEGLKGKRIDDIERAEEFAHAENIYRKALRKERAHLIVGLEDAEDREKTIKEALLKTTALEAISLYNLKTEIVNNERPVGFREAALKKMQGVEKWYRSLRPRNKILIAGGLFAAGGAGVALGGVIGAGMVGAAFTGKALQRALSGAGAGIALEQAMKSAQGKAERRAMERAFGSGGSKEILERFENGNSVLDEALLKLESAQGRRKIRRYVIAATGGGLLASGIASSAFEYVGEHTGGLVETIRERLGWVPNSQGLIYEGSDPGGVETARLDIHQESGHSLPGIDDASEGVLKEGVELPGAESLPNLEPHIVEPGDNMYIILQNSFPEIAELEGYPQANAIENIIAVIKEDPESFGIKSGDVNLLSVGDSIDLEKINELLETERVDGQSIVDRAQSLAANISTEDLDSVSVAEPEVSENLTQNEGLQELREFFRQTPGYLTHTVALEEFLEMIKHGDVSAEMLRSFEEGALGSFEEMSPDRYEYELDVLSQGEEVYGVEEYERIEKKMTAVFDRLWSTSLDESVMGTDATSIDLVDAETGDVAANIESPEEVVSEDVSRLTSEQIHHKLDSLFSSADANITHSEVAEGGSTWSQRLEGTLNPSDYLQMEASFRSFLDMIRSGELSAEEFARYVSEGRGGEELSRAHLYVYEFGLIKDPTSFRLSFQEVEMARRNLESVFRALWLERSR